MNSCDHPDEYLFLYLKRSDSVWPYASRTYFSSFPILPSLGRFPLSAHQSIGSETHGAQRGLGDVLAALRTTTRSARMPPSDGLDTFELDRTDFQLFIWKATVSQLLQDIFLSFPVAGWDSNLLFLAAASAAAVDLDDFPSYSRVTVTIEEWKRCKQLVGENKLYRATVSRDQRKREWFHRPTGFRTKVGAKRTNGTRMRHQNPRRRTPANRKPR